MALTDTAPIRICEFDIEPLDLGQTTHAIRDRIQAGEGLWLVTVNLEMVSKAKREPAYHTLIHAADAFVADGMPLVWASRKKAPPGCPERVTGVDLVRELLAELDASQIGIIGGEDPAAAMKHLGFDPDRVEILNERLTANGEAFDRIGQQFVGRQVIFVALGVPKQDQFCLALRARIPNAVVMGVGGTFELLGAQKKRAPEWMQDRGLEWLFRLIQEPRRLWRRFFIAYPPGVLALLRDLGKKS
jgi:N-acetylglucosaminyldiphosphoundecaprenol N-acetyl-beta-D-mannosaminyltransferase